MSGKYDFIIEPESGMEYGILKGYYYNKKVVFIKLPPNSDCYGYKKKYFRFAKELNQRTGYSVVCAENHGDENSEKYDIEILKKYPNMEYIFVGIDRGAIYGLSRLCHKIDFKKMMLINMPISYELGETIDLLSRVDRKKIKFVYGDKDSSYRYTPLLKRLYADVVTVKGADHSFMGMSYSFVDLQKLI